MSKNYTIHCYEVREKFFFKGIWGEILKGPGFLQLFNKYVLSNYKVHISYIHSSEQNLSDLLGHLQLNGRGWHELIRWRNSHIIISNYETYKTNKQTPPNQKRSEIFEKVIEEVISHEERRDVIATSLGRKYFSYDLKNEKVSANADEGKP